MVHDSVRRAPEMPEIGLGVQLTTSCLKANTNRGAGRDFDLYVGNASQIESGSRELKTAHKGSNREVLCSMPESPSRKGSGH